MNFSTLYNNELLALTRKGISFFSIVSLLTLLLLPTKQVFGNGSGLQDGDRPFITLWKTDNPGITAEIKILIPADTNYSYLYNIYWENLDNTELNGTATALTGNDTIVFPVSGTYRLEVSGQFPKIYFNNVGDKSKILSVEQWGDIDWKDMRFAFRGCDQISIHAIDAPNLNQVSDMWGMFWGSSINQSINHWDVSNVKDIGNLFRDALQYNQPLDNWDVSSVTNMPQVFMNTENFNQDIGNWDVSNVTNMGAMFNGARSFNQEIGSWNVGNVKQMNAMFQLAASFNQNIGNWDTKNVTRMDLMFRGATSFNQPIGNWDLSNVSQIDRIFNEAKDFNQDIKQWDLRGVTDLTQMFNGAISFNQDISNWDLSHVNNMSYMFHNASSFNQDISSWDVSNATNMSYMLRNSGISPINYDALLDGWLANGVSDDIKNFQVSGLRYCEGTIARSKLIQDHDWQIVEDVKDCSQVITFSALIEREYGSPDFKLTGRVSSGAKPIYTSSDPNIAIINGDSVKIMGVGTTTITAARPSDGNYSAAASVSRELKIKKGVQVISFDPIELKELGGEDFDLVASVNTGLPVKFTSSDENVAIINDGLVTIIGVGTTVITASQEGNAFYYAAQPVMRTLIITKKDQQISFNTINAVTLLEEEVDLVAFSSSGLPISFLSSDESVATIQGSKAIIHGSGTAIITASQTGNEFFKPAEEIKQALKVTKAAQHIVFELIEDRPSDAPNFELVASSSSGLPISFSISGPAVLEGKIVSLNEGAGLVTVTATQSGNEIYQAAESVVISFEVTAVTGIHNLRALGIEIYPNPVSKTLVIDLTNKSKKTEASIYSLEGKVIQQYILKPNVNKLEMADLKSGIYILKIKLPDETFYYHKIIKK